MLAVLKGCFQMNLFQNSPNGFVTSAILHFFCILCLKSNLCNHIKDNDVDNVVIVEKILFTKVDFTGENWDGKKSCTEILIIYNQI